MLKDHLNEKGRRLWCASESMELGRGGITLVSKATGVSRTTITEGIKELKGEKAIPSGERIRRSGGGRKKITETQKGILESLEKLVDPVSRGDPESPLRWTCKSTTKIAKELQAQSYKISQRKVCDLLKDELGYSLQSNKKTKEGGDHPDRNEQFEYINRKAEYFTKRNLPTISVDTKKKEKIGNYKNNGKEYFPKGKPEEVKVYDFETKRASPYGVYDTANNKGWVSVGISADTAKFAVNTIRRWWKEMGQPMYGDVKDIFITADGGGSNGRRNRMWKWQLQKFANETGITIHVSHFPPGTSKWNKIEHRMFSHISQNWRAHPLRDYATVVNLIANTKTKKGLEIRAILDENHYEKGLKVSDENFYSINLSLDDFHGEWNYSISSN